MATKKSATKNAKRPPRWTAALATRAIRAACRDHGIALRVLAITFGHTECCAVGALVIGVLGRPTGGREESDISVRAIAAVRLGMPLRDLKHLEGGFEDWAAAATDYDGEPFRYDRANPYYKLGARLRAKAQEG